jgi:hypothetical protein
MRRETRGPEGKAKAARRAAVPSHCGLKSTLMAAENISPALACQGVPGRKRTIIGSVAFAACKAGTMLD